MIRKKYIAFFIISLLGFTKISLSQQLCLHIDSIKVYSLPWNLHTVIALDEQAVRNFEITNLKKVNPKFEKQIKIFKDYESINGFVAIDLTKAHELKNKEIDARIVIDLYYTGGIISLPINAQQCYKYLGKSYNINISLDKWISKNISN